MHYCMLYVLCVLIFTQLLRYSQRSGAGVIAVGAVNYAAAAILSCVVLAALWSDVFSLGEWHAAALGAANGCLYFIHLLVLLAAYRLAGIGVSSAFVALGILIPVLVSWYAWSEPMSGFKWAAVGLLPITVILMRPADTQHKPMTLKGDAILLLAFVMAGTIGTVHKSLSVYAAQGSRPLYQAALFAAAAVSSLTYARLHGHRYNRRIVALGSILGASNVLVTLFILLSLSAMPAVIFYPVAGSLLIALSVIVSWILWGESVTKRQLLGLFFAGCIVVLANL